MMFWDSSALIPFLTQEKESAICAALLQDGPTMVVWAL
jgi:hypothetical protein